MCILWLATACGPKVTTKSMTNRNINTYNTYAWLPDNDSIQNKDYNNRLVHQTIIEEVNKRMLREGFNLDRENPELLVLVHTMFDEETDVSRRPVYSTYDYYGPGFYMGSYYQPYYYYNYSSVPRVIGYDVDVVTYTEGTLVIDFIDARTNQLVWRGTAEGIIEPINVEAEIANYVDEIYDDFPKM